MQTLISEPRVSDANANGLTSRLMACGVAAGPVYISVALIQAFTRPGFDLLRHDVSLLSNGELGWVQITNFLVSGLLTMACALGMKRALHSGPASGWGALLVGVYGLGLIGAGIFTADPAQGFPPGAPAQPGAISWHGLLHFVSAAPGFLALIAACFVLARRFAAAGERKWAAFSVLSGISFFAGFAGIASGSGQSWIIICFWIALVLVWAWLALVALRLINQLKHQEKI